MSSLPLPWDRAGWYFQTYGPAAESLVRACFGEAGVERMWRERGLERLIAGIDMSWQQLEEFPELDGGDEYMDWFSELQDLCAFCARDGSP